MSKIFLYDLETTGLNAWQCAIHEIAYRIIEDEKIIAEEVIYLKPYKGATVVDAALAVGKVTKEGIETYPEYSEGYQKLIKVLDKNINKFDKSDKLHLMGYNNISFDNGFLREFFKHHGNNYFGSYFWSDSIDVMSLASDALRLERRNLKDFKLSTVADYLKIKVDHDSLHTASYDLDLTYQIYTQVRKDN
jgi:DNA polymerase III subunit epsilon